MEHYILRTVIYRIHKTQLHTVLNYQNVAAGDNLKPHATTAYAVSEL